MNTYNDWGMLNKAIKIAVQAHDGQVDKNGEPYILHPLRVMMSFRTIEEKTCAILHDVVEDTSITLDQLKDEGFNDNIIIALNCLTRRDNESYYDFIGRILRNEMASSVKLVDIEDNISKDRLSKLEHETAIRLYKKYEKAHNRILDNFGSGAFL